MSATSCPGLATPVIGFMASSNTDLSAPLVA
jgi:hypothetical protein